MRKIDSTDFLRAHEYAHEFDGTLKTHVHGSLYRQTLGSRECGY